MASNGVGKQQQIAVFGESGSGKTVLLSTFYGMAQESSFKKASRFEVLADDIGQGTRLHQNFLKMKNANERPVSNSFSSTSYGFSIKRRLAADPKPKATEDLRVTWHDYPGQWFSEDPGTEEENARRILTFRALLGSDVAVLLIDGAKLAANAGEEDRYLKALFTMFRNGLVKLRDDLLDEGKPLTRFPRIWILGLSKADLLPDLDATGLKEIVVEKAGAEMIELRDTLASLVEMPEALSVGEDFVLLSSAKFEPTRIDVTARTGVDLILPMTAVLPFDRLVKWANLARRGSKVANDLARAAIPVAVVLAPGVKALSRLGKFAGPIGFIATFASTALATGLAEADGGFFQKLEDQADKNHDFLAAVLAGFGGDLQRAEDAGVLLRSHK